MMIKGLLCTLVFCMSAVVYAQDDTPKIEDYQRVEIQRVQHIGSLVGSLHPQRYPVQAVRMGLEGTTKIEAVISPEGEIKSASVFESSGYDRLDEAALETVRQGRFRKTGAWTKYLIPVQFKLK